MVFVSPLAVGRWPLGEWDWEWLVFGLWGVGLGGWRQVWRPAPLVRELLGEWGEDRPRAAGLWPTPGPRTPGGAGRSPVGDLVLV